MQKTWVRSLGQEDPLEKEMAPHSSTLAWKSHGQRSLVDYSPWDRKESDTILWASQVALVVKNPPADGGDMGSIPGSGRSPGEGHGNPFQYSYLENPMDRGAWWATVQGSKQSDTTEETQHTHVQGPTTVQHRELYLILCLYGKGILKKKSGCGYVVADSLCCTLEAKTAL